jgi:ribonuclease-3
MRETDLQAIENAIGHRFADRALLIGALSHSSLGGRSAAEHRFDRLEFLGDRVFGLVAADLLIRRFPSESEGDLGRRFAALASEPMLAALAGQLELGGHLDLAPGEEKTGGRHNPSVLADAFEALLAALFRDGGIEPAARLVERLLAPHLAAQAKPPIDPKTALQEWAQAQSRPLPRYRLVESTGPAHATRFEVEVLIGEWSARGAGRSKQAAEREAASRLLAQMALL